MITVSLSNQGLYEALDEKDQKTYYGCDQNWYKAWWKRMAGCGPTTASNLAYYLKNSKTGKNPVSKAALVAEMEEMWEYVTPTAMGVNTTEIFFKGLNAYAEAKGLAFKYEFLDIPQNKNERPELAEVIDFISTGLSQDAPIAFLNLCNGEVENLYEWHWVTAISLEYEEDGRAFINILDEGKIKNIDLALWHRTTKRGGGLVYFTTQA